jgi:hypothetical protein
MYKTFEICETWIPLRTHGIEEADIQTKVIENLFNEIIGKIFPKSRDR